MRVMSPELLNKKRGLFVKNQHLVKYLPSSHQNMVNAVIAGKSWQEILNRIGLGNKGTANCINNAAGTIKRMNAYLKGKETPAPKEFISDVKINLLDNAGIGPEIGSDYGKLLRLQLPELIKKIEDLKKAK
ncbi:MAG: hypothetical protein V1817_02475 [Candidatus Micrarchaeota archaeon]